MVPLSKTEYKILFLQHLRRCPADAVLPVTVIVRILCISTLTSNFEHEFINFYRASSYAGAVLGVIFLSVCPSVQPSVTHVLCDKTKECTVDIMIPH